MSVNGAALEIENLRVHRGETLAVDGVDLRLAHGELMALVGPSGCGKTSLLRAVAGFEVPSSGSIWVGGVAVAGGDAWVEAEHRRVGMVFQQGALFPHLTVLANVMYGLRGRKNAADRAAETIAAVGMDGFLSRYPDELSGGQQQRVALARALAPEPRLVLLDEPFAGLDADLRSRLRVEVRGILKQMEASAVLVTHDQEEALSIADQVAVMSRGKVPQVAPPETVYRRPANLEVAEFFGGGSVVEADVRDGALTTAFGTFPCPMPNGAVSLFVRPEDLGLEPAPEDGAEESARIVDRRFFGHDVLDRVRLPDGSEFEVRALSSRLLPIGSRVRLRFVAGSLAGFDERSEGSARIAISG